MSAAQRQPLPQLFWAQEIRPISITWIASEKQIPGPCPQYSYLVDQEQDLEICIFNVVGIHSFMSPCQALREILGI